MSIKFKNNLRVLVMSMALASCLPLAHAGEVIKGRLIADLVGKVSTEMTGERSVRIKEMLVRKGDRVRKGDLLARLSSLQLKADRLVAQRALEEAQAGIGAAKSNLAGAKLVYMRQARLKESPSFRRASFEDAEVAFRTAESRLLSAQSSAKRREAEVARIELEIRLTEIVAPYDGIVVGILTNVGAAVTQKDPHLISGRKFFIFQSGFEVPAGKIALFQSDRQVLYSLKDGVKRSARVRAIMPRLDNQMGKRIVRLRPDNDKLPAVVLNRQPVKVYVGD